MMSDRDDATQTPEEIEKELRHQREAAQLLRDYRYGTFAHEPEEEAWLDEAVRLRDAGNFWAKELSSFRIFYDQDDVDEFHGIVNSLTILRDMSEDEDWGETDEILSWHEDHEEEGLQEITSPELKAAVKDFLAAHRVWCRLATDGADMKIGTADATECLVELHEELAPEIGRLELTDDARTVMLFLRRAADQLYLRSTFPERFADEKERDLTKRLAETALPHLRRLCDPECLTWKRGMSEDRIRLADAFLGLLSLIDPDLARRTAAVWLKDPTAYVPDADEHLREIASASLLFRQFDRRDVLPRLDPELLPEAHGLPTPPATELLTALDLTRRPALIAGEVGTEPAEALARVRELDTESLSESERRFVGMISDTLDFEGALRTFLTKDEADVTGEELGDLARAALLGAGTKVSDLSADELFAQLLRLRSIPAFGNALSKNKMSVPLIKRAATLETELSARTVCENLPVGVMYFGHLLLRREDEFWEANTPSDNASPERCAIENGHLPGSVLLTTYERFLPEKRPRRTNRLTQEGALERLYLTARDSLCDLRFLSDEVLLKKPVINIEAAPRIRALARELHEAVGTGNETVVHFTIAELSSTLLQSLSEDGNPDLIGPALMAASLFCSYDLKEALITDPYEAVAKKVPLERIGSEENRMLRILAIRLLSLADGRAEDERKAFAPSLLTSLRRYSGGVSRILPSDVVTTVELISRWMQPTRILATSGFAKLFAEERLADGERPKALGELLLPYPEPFELTPLPFANVVPPPQQIFIMRTVEALLDLSAQLPIGRTVPFDEEETRTETGFDGFCLLDPHKLNATFSIAGASGSLKVSGKSVDVKPLLVAPLFEEEMRFVDLFGWELLSEYWTEANRIGLFDPKRARPLKDFFTTSGKPEAPKEILPAPLGEKPCWVSRIIAAGGWELGAEIGLLVRTDVDEKGRGAGDWVATILPREGEEIPPFTQLGNDEAACRLTFNDAANYEAALADVLSGESFAYLKTSDGRFVSLEEAYALKLPRHRAVLGQLLLRKAAKMLDNDIVNGRISYKEASDALDRKLKELDPDGIASEKP